MFTPDLPKTRSGKIMRRLLRDIAQGRALGDTTTLADAGVVEPSARTPEERGIRAMPFGFGRKKDAAAEVAPGGPTLSAADARGARSVHFHGFTEDSRLEGEMRLHGRLLDLLNQREAVPVADVRWAPADGSSPPRGCAGDPIPRPLRPDRRHRRRRYAGRPHRGRASCASGAQGGLRCRPRGPAVPGGRNRAAPPGVRAGVPPRAGEPVFAAVTNPVAMLATYHWTSAMPTRSSSTASTCAGSGRSIERPASPPAASWPGTRRNELAGSELTARFRGA